MSDGNGQNDYQLGKVVGLLEGIDKELKQQREDNCREHESMSKRLTALEKSNSSIRWLERIGTVLGGIIGGFVSGKAGL